MWCNEFNFNPDAFFKCPNVIQLLQLQEMLSDLDKSNVKQVIFKIRDLGFLNDFKRIRSLVMNILHFSMIRFLQIPSFLEIVAAFKDNLDFIGIFEMSIEKRNYFIKRCIDCGFLNEMEDDQFQDPSKLELIIQNDDLDAFCLFCSEPLFEYEKYTICIDAVPRSSENICYLIDLIDYAALCGSVKCFKFLMNQNHSVFQFWAIAGGNTEIIRLIEQEKGEIIGDRLNFEFAMFFHRNEIFDWLVEKYPDFKSYFEHKKYVRIRLPRGYCFDSFPYYNYNEQIFKFLFVHGLRFVNKPILFKYFDEYSGLYCIELLEYYIENFEGLSIQTGLDDFSVYTLAEKCQTNAKQYLSMLEDILLYQVPMLLHVFMKYFDNSLDVVEQLLDNYKDWGETFDYFVEFIFNNFDFPETFIEKMSIKVGCNIKSMIYNSNSYSFERMNWNIFIYAKKKYS